MKKASVRPILLPNDKKMPPRRWGRNREPPNNVALAFKPLSPAYNTKRGTTLIVISSCMSSFMEYGMRVCVMSALFLQYVHL